MHAAQSQKLEIINYLAFEYPGPLKQHLPDWHQLYVVLNRNDFTAETACSLLEMTHRRINDWDGRGYLGYNRDSEGGWRRFSALDLFALAVLKDVKKLGLPLKLFPDMKVLDLPQKLWLAMPSLARGRQSFIATNFEGSFLQIFEAESEYHFGYSGKWSHARGGQKVSVGFEEEQTGVFIVGLRRIARRLLPNLKFNDLIIRVDDDWRVNFEVPNKGPLVLKEISLR